MARLNEYSTLENPLSKPDKPREVKSPVKHAPVEVRDRVQYCPNYDQKSQTAQEAMMRKVGPKDKRY